MQIPRRTVLGTGLLASTAAVTGCGRDPGAGSPANWVQPSGGSAAVAERAATAAAPAKTPAGIVKPGQQSTRLTLTRFLEPTPGNPKHPTYAGAVALVAEEDRRPVVTTVGHALRYTAGPVELAPAKRVAMRSDSIFDLASLTKVCTAILVLQLVDRGLVELDAPVRTYLPEFTGTGKDQVTVRMLLTHTSALPVGAKVTGFSTTAERWQSVLTTPLVAGGVPGRTFRYSSVGPMVLGRLVEKLTGKSLDAALRDNLTTPLGLRDTGYRPLDRVADKQRLVATDARTSRGLLRGTVHDDVANILGGVAGHAGLFGTAQDVAVIGRMLLDGGVYDGRRILSAEVVGQMLTNATRGKPVVDADHPDRPADHGLGVNLNQPWYMGKLASPTSFGHTGFTGTSLLVVPARRLVAVLLTNRAHPNWTWANPDFARVAFHNLLAV